jgi:hypothetical protein
VQAVAEKARANVRKMLAPTLEAQRLEEEKRAAAEAKHAEETARAAAEEKRRQDEEQARNAPPPPPLVTGRAEGSGIGLRGLSLIPGIIGVASAGVGAYFLISASSKYRALVNGTVDYSTALGYRSSGPTDATVGYVLIGVGAAGIVTAVTMLILGGRSSPAPAVSLVPTPGGAFMTLSFGLGGAR